MKVFLYLRNTKDWGNTSIKDIISSSNTDFYKSYKFVKNIIIWNNYIKPNYFDFKNELKKIVMSFWKIPYYKDESLDFIKKLNDEDILVPVDDDDWFHPNLENFLLKNIKDHQYGYWETLVSTSFMDNRFCIWKKSNRALKYTEICSNCYFFKVGVLKKLPPSQSRRLLAHHPDTLIKASEMGLKIMKKNNIMSIYNRNPSSHSILNHLNKMSHFKNIFKVKNCDLPLNCIWAKEGIDKIDKLISSVEISDEINSKTHLSEIKFI